MVESCGAGLAAVVGASVAVLATATEPAQYLHRRHRGSYREGHWRRQYWFRGWLRIVLATGGFRY